MDTTNEYRRGLKERIINYALQEFFKRGIKAVKMDDLSRGLHVSKRTVYEIFGDKEELLLEGLKARDRELAHLLQNFLAHSNRNVIDIICYFYQLQLRLNKEVGVLFYEEIHKMPRIVAYLEELHDKQGADRVRFFNMGVKEGLFRDDVDYELISAASNIAMNEFMHQQFYKQFSMQKIYDNYSMVLLRGICTERGLQLLNRGMRHVYEE